MERAHRHRLFNSCFHTRRFNGDNTWKKERGNINKKKTIFLIFLLTLSVFTFLNFQPRIIKASPISEGEWFQDWFDYEYALENAENIGEGHNDAKFRECGTGTAQNHTFRVNATNPINGSDSLQIVINLTDTAGQTSCFAWTGVFNSPDPYGLSFPNYPLDFFMRTFVRLDQWDATSGTTSSTIMSIQQRNGFIDLMSLHVVGDNATLRIKHRNSTGLHTTDVSENLTLGEIYAVEMRRYKNETVGNMTCWLNDNIIWSVAGQNTSTAHNQTGIVLGNIDGGDTETSGFLKFSLDGYKAADSYIGTTDTLSSFGLKMAVLNATTGAYLNGSIKLGNHQLGYTDNGNITQVVPEGTACKVGFPSSIDGVPFLKLEVNGSVDYPEFRPSWPNMNTTRGRCWEEGWKGCGPIYGNTTIFAYYGQDQPPLYSNIGTNTTIASYPCDFQFQLDDDVGLSKYRFGTNNTGTWINDTWTDPWSEPPFYDSWLLNVSKTLNSTVGVVVQYRLWFNDTANQFNDTGIQSLTTTAELTFGKTDVGASSSASSTGNLRACRFQAPENGDVVLIRWWGRHTKAAGVDFKGVIYSDNSGAPDTRLAESTTISVNNAFSWWNFTLDCSVTTDSWYWLTVFFNYSQSNGDQLEEKYDAGSSNQWAYRSSITFNGAPNPFGTPAGYFDRNVSIYAVYQATGADNPPTYSNVGSNNTIAGQSTRLYTEWADDNGLSTYIVEHNNTGSFQNLTGSLPSNPDWANETILLNSTAGVVVAWRSHANDTSDNWNNTAWQYITAETELLFEHYNTGDDTAIGIEDVYWRAQSFTLNDTAHTITSVKLKMRRTGNPGTMTVGIRATGAGGHPTGSDLTSGTINATTFTTGTGAWYRIAITEYQLSANTKYAIVCRIPQGNESNYAEWRQHATTATYDGGSAKWSGDSGASWSNFTGSDFMFEVWGINPTQGITVTLNDPSDDATLYLSNVNFNYTPTIYGDSFHNSTLFTNVTGTWQGTANNASVIQNGVLNTINYTFASPTIIIWNVRVFNSTHFVFAASNRTLTLIFGTLTVSLNQPADDSTVYSVTVNFNYTPTVYHNQFHNASLFTNETGTWQAEENNATALVNATLNMITHTFAGATTIIWNVQVYNSTGYVFAAANWTLTISIYVGENSTTVTLNAPSNDATLYTANIFFNYTPTCYGDIIQNATLYTNASGSWGATQTNTTAIVNATLNTINYTFSSYGTYVWNVQVWNTTHGVFAVANWTVIYAEVSVWYYYSWTIQDLDSNDVEAIVSWVLYNGSQPLSYTEGTATLLNGTYNLRVSYHTHLINTTNNLETWVSGNSTVTVTLQMKRQLATSRYIAFNSTISSITVNSASDTNLTFTVTGSGSFWMIIDVTQNASYLAKDGVNQTGWIYATSPAAHIHLNTSSLSVWSLIFPEAEDGFWFPTINWPTGIGTLTQFLFAGDFFGFIQAAYVLAFQNADLFYAVILLIFSVVLYIRVKSILFMSILWILVGSLILVATPLISGVALLIIIFGLAAMMFKLFMRIRGGGYG